MKNRMQVREQRISMIADWLQSGLSQKQYCLQNHIGYQVFHYWHKAYRRQQSSCGGSFVTVEMQAPQQPNVEVLLADGKRIIFHQAVSVAFLKALIC